MGRLLKGLFRFIRAIVLIVILMIAVMIATATGGYYLLDYLIRGEVEEVPNLRGKTKTEAIDLLMRNGLLPKYPMVEFASQDWPAGTVIEQRPYAGSRVKKRRYITLVLSTGPVAVSIPKLVNRREEEAESILRSNELELGLRARIYHATQPKGMIVAQDPLPGKGVTQGKKVNILISQGPLPPSYITPDFKGRNALEMLQQVNREPFHLEKEDLVYEYTKESAKWNRVIDQNPRPGFKFKATPGGDRVTLTVGTGGRESSSAENKISAVRLIHVTFPVPPASLHDALALFVWDDTYTTFKMPSVIPVQLVPGDPEIDAWVPVFGDALVMLGIMDKGWPQTLPILLQKQYFKAGEQR